jgi:hypothetical protein
MLFPVGQRARSKAVVRKLYWQKRREYSQQQEDGFVCSLFSALVGDG